MYDAALEGLRLAEQRKLEVPGVSPGREFALATIHRAENTDDSRRLLGILDGLDRVAAEICPVLLPLHPRTRKIAGQLGWSAKTLQILSPFPYLAMLFAESRARMIFTDSGGVQKEAYFFQRPCITLRDETEWVETLAGNCNVLVSAYDPGAILEAARRVHLAGPWANPYGDGKAGRVIAEKLRSGAG
jgi:UDP-GlcNAc3NAcA epimerase